MRRLTILVDLDGICADMLSELIRRYNIAWQDNIHVEQMDRFHLGHFTKPGSNDYLWELMRAEGLVRNLKPIEGFIQTVVAWRKQGHKVIFLSHPPGPHGAKEKYEWVDEKVGWAGFEAHRDLALVGQKEIVKGDIIIDDKPKTAKAYREAWSDVHILTIEWPYNRNCEYYDLIAPCYRNTVQAWQRIDTYVQAVAHSELK